MPDDISKALILRPYKCRMIRCRSGVRYFKPRAIPLSQLEKVSFGLDELEAVRLADLEGLYQEQAAAMRGVSN